MQVSQLINRNGNPASNQFVIQKGKERIFQSYDTKIAKVKDGKITLDNNAMEYSKTTSKHLYIFLNMTRKKIEQRIKEGTIKVRKLN